MIALLCGQVFCRAYLRQTNNKLQWSFRLLLRRPLTRATRRSRTVDDGGLRGSFACDAERRVLCGLTAVLDGCEGVVSRFIEQRINLGSISNLHLE